MERKLKSKTMDKNQVTMWVVRDKDGRLYMYDAKPAKFSKIWADMNLGTRYCSLLPDFFPSVKWEDAEPTEVVLTLKK